MGFGAPEALYALLVKLLLVPCLFLLRTRVQLTRTRFRDIQFWSTRTGIWTRIRTLEIDTSPNAVKRLV